MHKIKNVLQLFTHKNYSVLIFPGQQISTENIDDVEKYYLHYNECAMNACSCIRMKISAAVSVITL